ncbi:MAG: hypothetical protein WC438_02120 [Candidatus Pacearchaeota archaeon]
MKRLNKKAEEGTFLGVKVVNLVIAVLCIIILITLGAKLFKLFSEEGNVKQAEDILNLINDKISYLTGGEYTENFLYMTIFPPEDSGWFLKSYQESFFPEKECVGKFKSCLCICNSKDCIGLKACKGMGKYTLVEGDFKEEILIGGHVNPQPGSGVFTTKEIIQLSTAQQELTLTKSDNKVIITEKK